MGHSLTTIANGVNKKTMGCDKQYLMNLVSWRYKSGSPSLSFSTDLHSTYLVALAFTPFDPFFDEINAAVVGMFESGIMSHIQQGFFNGTRIKSAIYETPTINLSMEHLEIGFIICMLSMTSSIVAFSFEVTIPKIRKLLIKVRDTIVVLKVVQELIRILSENIY